MNGYLYILFVYLVAQLGKQDESKDKRSTKRARKFEKTMRHVARKSEGWCRWNIGYLGGQTKMHLTCWTEAQHLRCYREAVVKDPSIYPLAV